MTFPISKRSEGRANYEPPSKDEYHEAIIAEVYDEGPQTYKDNRTWKARIVIRVEEENEDGSQRELQEFIAVAKFKNNEWGGGLGTPEYPSKLRKYFETVLGRKLTPQEEEDGLDVNFLVGKNLRVFVKHKDPNEAGRIYGYVDSMGPSKNPITLGDDYTPIAERGKDKDEGASPDSGAAGKGSVPF